MALAFTLVDTWDDGRRIHVAGTIAASGNYATGGDTLDLTSIGAQGIPSTKPPIQGTAWSESVSAGERRGCVQRTRGGGVSGGDFRGHDHVLRHLPATAIGVKTPFPAHRR